MKVEVSGCSTMAMTSGERSSQLRHIADQGPLRRLGCQRSRHQIIFELLKQLGFLRAKVWLQPILGMNKQRLLASRACTYGAPTTPARSGPALPAAASLEAHSHRVDVSLDGRVCELYWNTRIFSRRRDLHVREEQSLTVSLDSNGGIVMCGGRLCSDAMVRLCVVSHASSRYVGARIQGRISW